MNETLDRYGVRLRELARDGVARLISRALADVGLTGEAAAKRAATVRLAVRSGLLRNSIRAEVRQVEGGGELALSASPIYARIQEEGGTIRPKRGRYLAIPLRGAVPGDRAGAGAFVFTSASGRKFLARRTEEGALILLAVLKESVTLKGRRYLAAGIEAALARLPDALDAQFEVALGD